MATADLTIQRRGRWRLPDSMSALADRDFRIVWMGQAVSMTGTWMQAIAQGLLVLELWDSAWGLGIVNFSNAVPSLVVMLFGGVLADRADKRRILIVTQVFMMALAAGVGLLVVTDSVEFWMIVAASALLGVAFGYDMPAYQAFLPELVGPEKIGQVVALNSSTFHGTRMVGPAIAGVVIGATGLATAYFLNAATFLAVILSLIVVRYRPRPREDGPHLGAIAGLKEGVRHAQSRPHIKTLLLLTAMNTTLVFPIVAILTPFYVQEVLGATGDEKAMIVGLLWASSGVGSVLGAMALVWWSREARAARIWAAVIAAPVGLTVMALTREAWVAIGIQTVLSFSFSSQLGLVQVMLQESTPGQFRGRVMSLSGISFNGPTPFAALAASGLAAFLGMPAVMLGAAALYAVIGTSMLSRSGGGISRVVDTTRAEYEALASESAIRPLVTS